MSWLITNTIATLLLPPASLLLMTGCSLLLWHRRPALARILAIVSALLLWLFSTPYIAETLLSSLEQPTLKISDVPKNADAIVVLGGGSYFNAPEYAGHTTRGTTLQRLRYAATLQRNSGLPLLLSGGDPLGSGDTEARQMKAVMEEEFRIPVRWLENLSANTFEAAQQSYRILEAAGCRRILLVTHAWHMPRAKRVFEQAGFTVIPAPTAFTTRLKIDVMAFLPDPDALVDSRQYLHELLGLLWYRLKSS